MRGAGNPPARLTSDACVPRARDSLAAHRPSRESSRSVPLGVLNLMTRHEALRHEVRCDHTSASKARRRAMVGLVSISSSSQLLSSASHFQDNWTTEWGVCGLTGGCELDRWLRQNRRSFIAISQQILIGFILSYVPIRF